MPNKALWLADVVSRNIVPLGGVLLLGWDARNVLLLYFVDTVLAMLVILAGLAGAFLPDGHASRRRQFSRGAGLIIPAMIVVVAATLPFVIGREFQWRAVIDDPALRIGILWQAIAALWSCRGLIRALRSSTPEQLKLERRFGLVLSRWLTMAFLAIVIPGDWLGAHGTVVLVAIYVVLSVWVEVAPHHFLAGMADDRKDDRSGAAPVVRKVGLANARKGRKRGR